MEKRKALLVINLGTPDRPEKKDVRRYLRQFLNDHRVIDIPWLAQKLLVNFIIIPFRVANSTRLYKMLWTTEGSPLKVYLDRLTEKLRTRLEGKYHIYKAMRYQKPDLKVTLEKIYTDNIDELIVFPMFPQYASSSTGSVADKVFTIVKKWEAFPQIRLISNFYSHPAFISAFANKILQYNPSGYEHIIFSYHGLPVRHIHKIHPGINCENCICENEMTSFGTFCYKATCYETTRLLTSKLNILKSRYTVSFQSRLSKNWLTPFTDKLILELAQKGTKRILCVAPSFVADCLETTVEIEYEYHELFKKYGGEQLTLVKSLNDSNEWVDAIAEIIQ